MIAVIFEVWPKADRKKDYLDIAADLRPLLEKIDGFISIERFESLYEPGQNSVALVFPRRGGSSGLAQHKSTSGRASKRPWRYFLQLSPARCRRHQGDYGMNEREQAPSDSREVHGA
jgi:hypothetical protein